MRVKMRLSTLTVKKSIAVTLAAVFAFSLAGCAGKTSNKNENSIKETTNSAYDGTTFVSLSSTETTLTKTTSSETTSSRADIGAEYEKASENNNFILYVNRQNLAVIIEDKATGKLLHSVSEADESSSNASWRGFLSSGFAIEFFNDSTPMPERLDATNGTPVITVNFADGGFDAHINYESRGIEFVIQTRLTNDGFSAHIPAESFKEAEGIRISTVYLYPLLGATRLGEKEGYMVIPEGAGAIISLDDHNQKYKAPYTKRVYGENLGTQSVSVSGKFASKEPVSIIAPFYGIAHTEEGLAVLSVVKDGQYNAEILAYPNGAVTEFNWITAKFIIRERYNMRTTRTTGISTSEKDPYFRDITVDYAILTGDDANYSGMAAKYRDIILAHNGIEKKDTDFLTRLDFFGADAKPWLMTYTTVAATTISQMDDILEDLANSGITDILAIYKGWQTGGITQNYGSGNFNVEGKLGSRNELLDAVENMVQRGNTFLLHQDFLQANPNRFYNTSKNIAKGINQVIMEIPTFARPFDQMYYVTPSRSLEFSDRFNKAFGSNTNIGVAVGSISNTLFSYYSQSSVFSRGAAAEGFIDAVSTLNMGNKALEQPFDYMWSDMDYFLDMPLYTSNYNFVSAEIPFIPMALKGQVPYFAEYVNFEPNENQFLLKMVEYGAFPSFLLTHESPSVLRETNSSHIYSSEYDVYRNQIISYTEELRGVYEAVKGSVIASHERLDGELVRVVYENGTELLINYSKSESNYNGQVIGAMSYNLLAGSV